MRRISPEPDRTYVPASELESQICEEVQRQTGEEIIALWTKSTYPYCDIHDRQLTIEHDYVVKTGKRFKDHFFSGQEIGVNVVDGKLSTEQLGDWFS